MATYEVTTTEGKFLVTTDKPMPEAELRQQLEAQLSEGLLDSPPGVPTPPPIPSVPTQPQPAATNFGVLAGDWHYSEDRKLEFEGTPVAFRGSFFIDKEGIVRHETINDLPLGRNIDEYLRIIDVWHHHQEYGEVCPANWADGLDAMKESREGDADYLSTH